MRMKMLRRLLMLAVIPICTAISLRAQNAGTDSLFALPLQFAGTAFGQAGAAAGKSFGFTVYITDWTTDQQVTDFINTLKENGSNGLVKAFEKTKDVGRVSPTGFVGNSFRFARATPTQGGGMHIVMVTDRPMRFWEVYNQRPFHPVPVQGLSCSMWTAQVKGREHSLRYARSSSTRRMNWK